MALFRSWNDFAAWLDARGMFHMDLHLGRMRSALGSLGLLPLPFRVAQVLGTNGKGSTCAFLAALAQRGGLRCGLYTSPHFVSPRERVMINGATLPDAEWLDAANSIAINCPDDLTYFEFLTILAILVFAKHGVDLAILEAGLGGANDATTAIPADVLCYTPIAMDHASVIGPGIADIARDKAAAIRSKAPVFSAPQYAPVTAILLEAALRHGATLTFCPPLPSDFRPGLRGSHQLVNAGVALRAWRALEQSAPAPCAREALAAAYIPGRLQIIKKHGRPRYILDGAHNPHGMGRLMEEFAAGSLPAPQSVIFSCLEDKDWQTGLAMLVRRFKDRPFIIPQLCNSRAAPAAGVAAFCDGMGARAATAPHMEQALGMAAPPVLITGSLYLLAAFFELYPYYLDPQSAHNH